MSKDLYLLRVEKQQLWKEYYKKSLGRAPSSLLVKALDLLAPTGKRFAIDLGCGVGQDTLCLINKGWHVLAVDKDKVPFNFFYNKLKHQSLIEIYISPFEEITFEDYPKAQLIHAAYSLPFCSSEHFHNFWKKIVEQIEPDGIFAGHFFGLQHSWLSKEGKMTFHSREEILSMFNGFRIEYVEEEIKDELDVMGNPVHWHVFHIIARKKEIFSYAE